MTAKGIGVEGAKAMSEMVKANNTLTTLNLGCEDEINKKEKKEGLDDRQYDWR